MGRRRSRLEHRLAAFSISRFEPGAHVSHPRHTDGRGHAGAPIFTRRQSLPARVLQSSVEPGGLSTHSLMQSRAGVYIVVPAYNEAPAIHDVVRDLRSEFANVVVVDDGSDDATAENAR